MAQISILFFFSPLYGRTIFIIHWWTFGFFCSLGLLRAMMLWIFICKSFCGCMFPCLLGRLIRTTLLASLSLKFYKLPNCFPKSLHPFIFPLQCVKFPLVPQDGQHLVLCVFFIKGILLGVKRYLIVVLMCISMTDDLDYVCICLMATHISSLVKCLFKSFACFKKCVVCLFLKVKVLYVLYSGRSSLTDMWFANIFCKSVACLFIPLTLGLKRKSF